MANKKITDATQISTMSGSDKLFVNSGDDLKQITLDQAVAASTPVQQLNSNTIKNGYVTQNLTVNANESNTTKIDYSSIQGKIIWSDVTWNNQKSDIPIAMIKYRDEKGKIVRVVHSWNVSQNVQFRVAVLYI